VTDAAIHRVSRESRRECGSVTEGQWIATGFSPRDDKTRVKKRSEVSYPTPFSIFTLHPSLLKSGRSVRLAPRGYRPAWAKTFLASSLLAFLETNTEAYVVEAVTGGGVVALS
jgi:hypothetical protein